MYKIKISSRFMYCRNGDLTSITQQVLDKMKDNAYFNNPTTALADVEKAFNEYVTAASNAGRRDWEMVSIKNDKKAVLRQLLLDLAQYVTQVCKGDKTMLISSGFEVANERKSAKKTAAKMEVDLNTPGQATLRVTRVAKARVYMHQYTPDPVTAESVWTSETSLNPAHTFTGFKSTDKVWFRVIVVEKDGVKTFFDMQSKVIQ